MVWFDRRGHSCKSLGVVSKAIAVYKTVGKVAGSDFDTSVVHTVFHTESDLLAAMSQPQVGVGRMMRCIGLCNCAHAEADINELVVLEFDFTARSAHPLFSAADQQAKIKAALEVQVAVEKLPSRPVVDATYIKIGLFKPKVFVYTVLQSASEIKKLLGVESELKAALKNAVSVTVDVPNDPSLRLCSRCRGRGHNDRLCAKLFGGPFAIKAIFKEPVSELGRLQIEADHKDWKIEAQAIFTGLKIGVKQPRRLVFLTYSSKELAISAYEHFFGKYHSLLSESFLGQFPDRATATCEECGSRHRNGACTRPAREQTESDMIRPDVRSHQPVNAVQLRRDTRRSSTDDRRAPKGACFAYWYSAFRGKPFCDRRDVCPFKHTVHSSVSSSSDGLGLGVGSQASDGVDQKSVPSAAGRASAHSHPSAPGSSLGRGLGSGSFTGRSHDFLSANSFSALADLEGESKESKDSDGDSLGSLSGKESDRNGKDSKIESGDAGWPELPARVGRERKERKLDVGSSHVGAGQEPKSLSTGAATAMAASPGATSPLSAASSAGGVSSSSPDGDMQAEVFSKPGKPRRGRERPHRDDSNAGQEPKTHSTGAATVLAARPGALSPSSAASSSSSGGSSSSSSDGDTQATSSQDPASGGQSPPALHTRSRSVTRTKGPDEKSPSAPSAVPIPHPPSPKKEAPPKTKPGRSKGGKSAKPAESVGANGKSDAV